MNIYCPLCAKEVSVSPKFFGKNSVCPHCKESFVVPSFQNAVETVTVFCPGCQTKTEIDSKSREKPIDCPHCNLRFQVPFAAKLSGKKRPAIRSHKTTKYTKPENITKEIKSLCFYSIFCSILGFLVFGLILGSVGIYLASKALQVIEETKIGELHRFYARTGQVLGVISVISNVIGIIVFVNQK